MIVVKGVVVAASWSRDFGYNNFPAASLVCGACGMCVVIVFASQPRSPSYSNFPSSSTYAIKFIIYLLIYYYDLLLMTILKLNLVIYSS